ncbi:hypothetical protein SNEBB_006677 [Seison nebaliae]|nr:hypothetical protein SNEBB_006677 [Seison nebaliae]
MVNMRRRQNSGTKNPPILSYEFVVQNRADILSVFCLIIVAGSVFKPLQPISSTFITLKSNITEIQQYPNETLYTFGRSDIFSIIFYTVFGIIFHAVIQEYMLDKTLKKIKFSKTKSAMYNVAGHLVTYHLISVFLTVYLLSQSNVHLNFAQVWKSYPEPMNMFTKIFFLIQIAYWLHWIPEVFLSKLKYEVGFYVVVESILNICCFLAAYISFFHKYFMILWTLHSIGQFVYYVSILCEYSIAANNNGKHLQRSISNWIENIKTPINVIIRLLTVVFTIVVFGRGLTMTEKQQLEEVEGHDEIRDRIPNFNKFNVRMFIMATVCFVQLYLLIGVQLSQKSSSKRSRENSMESKKSL